MKSLSILLLMVAFCAILQEVTSRGPKGVNLQDAESAVRTKRYACPYCSDSAPADGPQKCLEECRKMRYMMGECENKKCICFNKEPNAEFNV